MIPTPDMPSLVAWLVDEELKAHNEAARYPMGMHLSRLHLIWMVITDPTVFAINFKSVVQIVYEEREKTYRKVIDKIQNGRINQRPHVAGEVWEDGKERKD
jgi:hypothetical protein